MSKQTRAEKKAEEARIVAEMESAMRGEDKPLAANPDQTTENTENIENDGGTYAPTGQKLYCKRCKSVMQEGVCPVCGYRTYMPMAADKVKHVRIIVAAVSIAVFFILFLVLRG